MPVFCPHLHVSQSSLRHTSDTDSKVSGTTSAGLIPCCIPRELCTSLWSKGLGDRGGPFFLPRLQASTARRIHVPDFQVRPSCLETITQMRLPIAGTAFYPVTVARRMLSPTKTWDKKGGPSTQ